MKLSCSLVCYLPRFISTFPYFLINRNYYFLCENSKLFIMLLKRKINLHSSSFCSKFLANTGWDLPYPTLKKNQIRNDPLENQFSDPTPQKTVFNPIKILVWPFRKALAGSCQNTLIRTHNPVERSCALYPT